MEKVCVESSSQVCVALPTVQPMATTPNCHLLGPFCSVILRAQGPGLATSLRKIHSGEFCPTFSDICGKGGAGRWLLVT